MGVGLGAGGALGFALETAAAPGTWVTPSVWIPITDESLDYTETRYFSNAIRQQTINQDAVQGPYHIEGDVTMEFDTRYVPYFLHASRNSVTKTGAGTPWTYKFQPSSGATIPSTNRTASITILRNNDWFAATGCVVTQLDITIENGVLMTTFHVIGLADVPESTIVAGGAPVPAFTTAQILGAAAHSIAVGDGALASGAAGVTAMSGTSVTNNFNGFTFSSNDNGTAQNRINQSRAAAYISMGITEATVTSNLDFVDRTDYDKFIANTKKRVQLISSNGTSDKVSVNVYNSTFESYPIHLGSWDNIVMADSTLHVLGSGGSNPAFDINIVSTSNISVA